MRHIRSAFPITIGLLTATACVLLACGDDDSGVTPTPDGSTPNIDASKSDTAAPPNDSGGGADTGIDTGADTGGGADTGVDAGPTMTTLTGSTGEIAVNNDIVIAAFYEDDTILRWSNAPSCVAFVRGPSKPSSVAGTLTVGGAIVGSDGGTDQTITVDADPSAGNTYTFFGTVYPSVDTFTANVQLTAAPGFAPMPVETFRPPRETPVTMTAPAAPDASGVLPAIPSSAPYVISWTPPVGGFVAEQQMSVSLSVTGSVAVTAKESRLYCTFPLNAGTGTIPANVLTTLKTRGGSGVLDAQIHFHAGGAKEVKTATGSYFVEVVRTDSTSLQFDIPTQLQ